MPTQLMQLGCVEARGIFRRGQE